MTSPGFVALSFFAALALSAALPFVVRPLLVKLGIVDVPNHRSSHVRPVLRGLGLAVLIAIVGVEAVATVLLFAAAPGSSGWGFLLTLMLATLAAGVLGLSEDIRGLSVPVRSLALLVIAAGSAATILWLAASAPAHDRAGLDASTLPTWALGGLFVYAVLFISSYINVANFMDGLNGISGFHGIIAGATFALSGIFSEQLWLAIAGAVLAAGWAGFLPWNLTKPGAFAGDVGSYLLGGAVAVTSFAALLGGVPVLATIGPMVIYFGDVGVTLVKRVRAGHKWDEPHKEHAYQRLQQLGMPHVAASAINATFTAAAATLGLLSFAVAPAWWLLLLALGLCLVVLYQLTPRLLAPRIAARTAHTRG